MPSDSRLALTRLGEDGNVDRGFGLDGLVPVSLGERDAPSALELRDDGSILLAGTSSSQPIYLARVTSRGAVDRRFGNRAARALSRLPRFEGEPHGVASIVPRGRGHFDVLGDRADGGYALRFKSGGKLDGRFGNHGSKTLPHTVQHAVKDATGRVFTFGSDPNRGGFLAAWLSRGEEPLQPSAGGWLRGWQEAGYGNNQVALQRGRSPLVFDRGSRYLCPVCAPNPRMIRFAGIPGRR